MPKEIYPSSYVCDCGKESHHSENTIREIKEKSCRKPQTLIADDGEHEIKFDLGEMVAMYCAKEQIEIPAIYRALVVSMLNAKGKQWCSDLTQASDYAFFSGGHQLIKEIEKGDG